jgi:hypothetical protein
MSDIRTIIDFVIEAAHNPDLRDEFKKFLDTNPDFIKIKAWFDERSYIISDDECIRILENKDRIFSSIQLKNY